MTIPPEARSAFIVCTFSMLGKIAAADGAITPLERKRVENFINSKLELDSKSSVLALGIFDEAAESPIGLREYAEKFAETMPNRLVLRDQVVEALIQVSAADGVLHPEEQKALRSAALLLGLSEGAFERMKEKYF